MNQLPLSVWKEQPCEGASPMLTACARRLWRACWRRSGHGLGLVSGHSVLASLAVSWRLAWARGNTGACCARASLVGSWSWSTCGLGSLGVRHAVGALAGQLELEQAQAGGSNSGTCWHLQSWREFQQFPTHLAGTLRLVVGFLPA